MSDEVKAAAEVADRSKLDDQTLAILDRLERDPFLDPAMTPDAMRAAFDAFYTGLPIPHGKIGDVEDREVAGPAGPLKVRVYQPIDQRAKPGPLILFFHGGAAIMGGIASYDTLCRRLTAQSGCTLISASYRLAPEFKFPAASDDAWAVLNWASENASALGCDPAQLVIAGESGGGNLAAGCAYRAGEEGAPAIAQMVLINPALGGPSATDSMVRYSRGFFFEPEALEWILSQYLAQPEQIEDPRASPRLARDLSKLPATFIAAAGHDILRDDIEDYARRLGEAGVPVEIKIYESTIHGFTVMAGAIDVGLTALDDCAASVRKHFGL